MTIGLVRLTTSIVTPGPRRLTTDIVSPGTPATFVIWRWERDTPNLVPQRIVILGRTVYDAQTLPVEVPFGRTARPVSPDQIGETA